MKNIVASILPRRTLLATLLAGLAATAYADNNLVVSQIYGAGGNNGATYNRDFIELFNRSAEPLSLSGLYLHYHSATGSGSSSVLALPAETLEPGQYYLVTFATGSNGSALDNGDLDSRAFSMGAGAGRVSISTRSTSIPAGSADASMVEIVGFGNANVFETAAAPSPSATTSISRKDAGCLDTDNNSLDFTAGTIAPRRKSSPFASCDNGPAVAPIVLNCPANLPAQQGSAASSRGYSTAFNLRKRLAYTGELRAIGDVLRDQLWPLSRVGFDAFATRQDRSIIDALKGLTVFSETYQASVDQPLPLFRRAPRGTPPELTDVGAGI